MVLVPVKTLKLADEGLMDTFLQALSVYKTKKTCPPHNIIIITKSDSDLTE